MKSRSIDRYRLISLIQGPALWTTLRSTWDAPPALPLLVVAALGPRRFLPHSTSVTIKGTRLILDGSRMESRILMHLRTFLEGAVSHPWLRRAITTITSRGNFRIKNAAMQWRLKTWEWIPIFWILHRPRHRTMPESIALERRPCVKRRPLLNCNVDQPRAQLRQPKPSSRRLVLRPGDESTTMGLWVLDDGNTKVGVWIIEVAITNFENSVFDMLAFFKKYLRVLEIRWPEDLANFHVLTFWNGSHYIQIFFKVFG